MQELCSMDEPIVHDQPCVKCGGAGPFYVSQPHSWCIECLQRTARQRYARDRLTIMAERQCRALAAAYATPPDARTRRQTMRILQAEAPAGTKVCTWCWRAHPRTRRFWGPGTTADGCDYYCRACRAILDKLRKRPRRRELAPTKALAAPVPWRPGPRQARASAPGVILTENVAYFHTSHPKKGIAMLPLPTEHDDKTFTYTQVEREGDLAIFCQAHKVTAAQRFEVVKIRVQPAHTWPNGTTSPEREAYPGSNSWGALGWTCFTLQAAQALARALRTAQEAA